MLMQSLGIGRVVRQVEINLKVRIQLARDCIGSDVYVDGRLYTVAVV